MGCAETALWVFGSVPPHMNDIERVKPSTRPRTANSEQFRDSRELVIDTIRYRRVGEARAGPRHESPVGGREFRGFSRVTRSITGVCPPFAQLRASDGLTYHERETTMIICGRRNCGRCKRWRHVAFFHRGDSRCTTCRREINRMSGRYEPLLDATPVKRVIAEHLGNGSTTTDMSAVTGVPERTLRKIHKGYTLHVMMKTADRVAVTYGLRLEDMWPSVFR